MSELLEIEKESDLVVKALKLAAVVSKLSARLLNPERNPTIAPRGGK